MNEQLNQFGDIWAGTAVKALWQGSALALFVWIIGRLWKRIPAGLHAAMWLLVCLKFVVGFIPFAIPIPVLPAVAPNSSTLVEGPISKAISVVPDVPVAASLSVQATLFILWVVGFGALLASVVVVMVRIRLLARRAEPATDAFLLESVKELSEKLGLPHVPSVRIAESKMDVLTVGVFWPQIIVSPRVIERCSPSEMRLVIAHELAHLKRGDLWLSLVAQITTLLFFFHPIAWLAAREFELARESACDEIAVRTLEAGPDVYGRLLVKLGTAYEPSTSLLVLGISSHFRALSRRISMLNNLSQTRSARWYRRTIFIACAAGSMLIAPWSLVPAQAALPEQSPQAGKGFVDLGLHKNINYRTNKRDIRRVMGDLLGVRRIKYTIDPAVQGTITLDARKANLETILMMALKQVDAGYRFNFDTGTYHIAKAGSGPAAKQAQRGDVSASNSDAKTLLEVLFKQFGQNYTIAPEVSGLVSIELQNVTLDEALHQLLPAIDCAFKVEDGVYKVFKNLD